MPIALNAFSGSNIAFIDGVFVNSQTGRATNGATAKLWHAAAFSSPPAKDTALPSSSFQIGASVTTGPSHGSDGGYRFTGISAGNYWVSIEHNGSIGWKSASIGVTSHASATGQSANDHHSEDHAQRHAPGGVDEVSLDEIAGHGRLRYVPEAATLLFQGTWTGATGATAVSAGAPAGAKAVQIMLMIQTQTGTADNGMGLRVRNGNKTTNSPDAAAVWVPPTGTGFWATTQATVEIRDTDGAIVYFRDYGGSGTVQGRIYRVGYWTDDIT